MFACRAADTDKDACWQLRSVLGIGPAKATGMPSIWMQPRLRKLRFSRESPSITCPSTSTISLARRTRRFTIFLSVNDRSLRAITHGECAERNGNRTSGRSISFDHQDCRHSTNGKPPWGFVHYLSQRRSSLWSEGKNRAEVAHSLR